MPLSDPHDELVRHLEWADATLWKAVLERVEAALDSKVEVWLHHIHIVQHAFLRVWRSEPLELPEPADFPDPPSLARWGWEAHQGIRSFLAQADDSELRRDLALPWAASVEQKWQRPIEPVRLDQSVMQVAMHSTHHRGQVAARLRELGTEPPLLDFIAWLWRGKPEAEWPEAIQPAGS